MTNDEVCRAEYAGLDVESGNMITKLVKETGVLGQIKLVNSS